MKQILILFLLTMLMSCEKEEDKATGVNGRVLEYGTNKPLEGIATILRVRGTPDGINTTDTAYTDKEGRFSLRVEEIGVICDLATEADGYYPYDGNYGITPQKVTTYPVDIILDPKAWVKMNIVNNSGIYYEMGFGLSTGDENPSQYKGEFFDYKQTIEVMANRVTKIVWNKKATSKPLQVYYDSLYIAAFDTVNYTINLE